MSLVINLILICFPCDRLAFFKAAYNMFDAEFYVKADDDIYLCPGEVSVYGVQLFLQNKIILFRLHRSVI
jgi:hypothetical protein